jgi:hypothetical protein
MHNQAWMRASQARMALLFDGADDASAVTHALMGAESIGHYDAGIGTASLGSLVPMLRAQVLTALSLFSAHFKSAMDEGLQRIAPCLLADRAWCELNLGHVDAARSLVAAAEQALREPCDLDDSAMAHARLAQACAGLHDDDAAARHRASAAQQIATHREQQQRLRALLDGTLDGLDPAQC